MNISKIQNQTNTYYKQNTVAFKGATNPNQDKKVLNKWTKEVSHQVALDINSDAQVPLKDFIWTLKQDLKNLVASKSNPEAPISADGIHGRVKSSRSIREKALSRGLYTRKEITEMGDVLGARICLQDTRPESFDAVITALGKMVKQGKIKILEVENYRTSPQSSYVNSKTLDKLAEICAKAGNDTVMIGKAKESGYTAVHLTVELPKIKRLAEIQIMGVRMEELKDLQDFVYKIECNKGVADTYQSIQKSLEKAIKGLDDFQKETYKRYQKDSYAFALHTSPKDIGKTPKFIPIPYSLPQELGFANIRKMKLECDAAARRSKSQQILHDMCDKTCQTV